MTMMTSTTASATPTTRRTARRAPPPVSAHPDHAPLAPIDDQRQMWLTHGTTPRRFEDAVAAVLAEREADGARIDGLRDLRAFEFTAVDVNDGHATLPRMAIRQVAGLDFGGSPEPMLLRRRAFNQLCEAVGAPAAFVSQLPAKLQRVNMSWLMARGVRDEGPKLLRGATFGDAMRGPEVRAILSDRYAAFDDDVLLELVDEALKTSGYRADAMVRASCIGPQLTLRITIPNEGVEVREGDVIEWGLDLGNSELGMRAVQVVPSTYRLVCLNGMRSTERGAVTRIRHVGNHQEIREDLAAAIPAAFAEARGDLDTWRRAADAMVDDALADLDNLRGFGLTQGETRAIGRELLQLPPETPTEKLAESLRHHRTTVYDVTNAITATARERSDVTTRLSLEETAHRYITRKVG